MNIIPRGMGKDNAIMMCCEKFLKRFQVNSLLRQVGATKEKGIPAYEIFAFLLGIIFSKKNLYTLLSDPKEQLSFSKDTVYRFLNKASVNWHMFVFLLSCSIVGFVKTLTSEERKSAIIVDDTAYYRDRSKKVELLSRFKDHSKNRYYKGFTLLNAGWSDGQTYLPLDYRLLANAEGKELLEGSHIKEDNRTLATRRRKEARTEKPKLVLDMLRRIKGTLAQARYVLFDSWFCSPSLILSIKGLGYDVVARMKNNDNFRYRFKGELIPISKIYGKCPKRRGRSKHLLSVTVEVCHKEFKETVPAKIVFVRDKGDGNKWIALISTDTTMSEDEIIALYGKRWQIEPFHQTIKSFLGLEKEFQGRSFDAISAHTAIVMARYLLLSLENRENKDLRSVNEGFRVLCDELEDISFSFAFELIVSAISQSSSEFLFMDKQRIDAFIEHFISCLPPFIKEKLRPTACVIA